MVFRCAGVSQGRDEGAQAVDLWTHKSRLGGDGFHDLTPKT
jgi:hypothetical protein